MNLDSFEQWMLRSLDAHNLDDAAKDCIEKDDVEKGRTEKEGAVCSCSEVKNNFFALVDQQIPEDEKHRLLQHVLTCPECVERLRNEYRLRILMRKSVASYAPASLRVRITETFTHFQAK